MCCALRNDGRRPSLALELNHNLEYALTGLSWCKLYPGSIEQVTQLVEQAIRLSPRDLDIGYCYSLLGTAHLLQSHIDEAIVWLEKARSAAPVAPLTRSRLAAAYALEGETERAVAELAEARRLSTDGRFSSIRRLMALGSFGVPMTRALFESTYFRRPAQGRDAGGVRRFHAAKYGPVWAILAI
jgi:tetratricopeptide (TPR) repeat protein